MRAPLAPWPRRLQWLPGLLLSVPTALLLWSLRGADENVRTSVAAASVVLALPWVIPAMVLMAALSVPVYMWLHTQGPVPPVLEWLGGTVLVGRRDRRAHQRRAGLDVDATRQGGAGTRHRRVSEAPLARRTTTN